MTREEQIALLRKHLHREIARYRLSHLEGSMEERRKIIRFVLYLIAREILDGHVREIVWTHPPFPEEEDHE